MSGWLDPYLDPSPPASRVAGLFDLSGVGTFVDQIARAATFERDTRTMVPPMPAPPPPPAPRPPFAFELAAPAPRAGPASIAAAPRSTASPSFLASLFGGGAPMALDLSGLVTAAAAVGDKVVAYRKADADANLARSRLEAEARLQELAIRSGGVSSLGGANVSGVLGAALPWLGLGLGAVVLLNVVRRFR